MLNEKGFTTLETDINVSGVSDSSELLETYSKGKPPRLLVHRELMHIYFQN